MWAFWQSGISMKSHFQTRDGPKRAAQAIEHASRPREMASGGGPAAGRMTTRSGRGRLLATAALGDLTNVSAGRGQQKGGIKSLISDAVEALGGGKRKRSSAAAAAADVENERADARPAKAGRVASGPKARKSSSA